MMMSPWAAVSVELVGFFFLRAQMFELCPAYSGEVQASRKHSRCNGAATRASLVFSSVDAFFWRDVGWIVNCSATLEFVGLVWPIKPQELPYRRSAQAAYRLALKQFFPNPNRFRVAVRRVQINYGDF